MDQDLRPRVFISSIMGATFGPYRDAAARAIERVGCQAVRAENHPASMVAPHTACLDMVASCDGGVTILVVRQSVFGKQAWIELPICIHSNIFVTEVLCAFDNASKR